MSKPVLWVVEVKWQGERVYGFFYKGSFEVEVYTQKEIAKQKSHELAKVYSHGKFRVAKYAREGRSG